MKPNLLLVTVVLAACSQSQSGPPLLVEFPEACEPETCVAAITVTTAGELAAKLDFTGAPGVGRYTTGCLPASGDITARGTITLRSTDVAVPAGCTSDCRQKVMFRLRGEPAGVTCLEPEHWYDFTLCAGVTIADTTVRVRPVIQDTHPSAFGNSSPVVDVLPACTAPCGSSQVACPATHTCWQTPRDQCAYCLGGDNEQCACWDGTAPLADGTHCAYFVSGDVEVSGTCVSGTCTR